MSSSSALSPSSSAASLRSTQISVHHGDSREVLRGFEAESVHSVVCDPPYALVSIGKRFGADNAAPCKVSEFYAKDGKSKGSSPYIRASAGFMGKKWDTGHTAFDPAFWAEVLRVLKPGGHLIAFGGTRSYHRLVCAIEDAGFEIRDQLAWLYGSGFPKSHDVSKGIDKAAPRAAMFGPFARHYEERRKAAELTHGAVCAAGGFFAEHNHGGASVNWAKGHNVPTPAQWVVLQPLLSLNDEWLPLIERVEAERLKTGEIAATRLAVAPGQDNDRGATVLDITAPATDEAAQWQGWGTALKPALEPIVLARKPLSGTVAANVLTHGCGALNIDGCRVVGSVVPRGLATGLGSVKFFSEGEAKVVDKQPHDLGRWPANVVHDGSEEVVEAFPEAAGQQRAVGPQYGAKASVNVYGDYGPRDQFEPRGDGGPAARFFYSAKADAEDRLGSKHPTVKPVDLMAWLCRLVTPPGGTVLDPFAGTGTTGLAAMREGLDCILIEREAEYVADIERRLAWARGEGRLTAQEMARTTKAADDLPLFAA